MSHARRTGFVGRGLCLVVLAAARLAAQEPAPAAAAEADSSGRARTRLTGYLEHGFNNQRVFNSSLFYLLLYHLGTLIFPPF